MLAYPAKLWLIDTDLNAVDSQGAKVRSRNHSVAVLKSQHHVINPANPRGALDDGVEDRLHVRRRAADYAQYLGGRGLMLQRLAQFSIAIPQFLKQPHVLDSDHGLVGEGFKKRNLFFRERLDYCATNDDDTDRLVLAH